MKYKNMMMVMLAVFSLNYDSSAFAMETMQHSPADWFLDMCKKGDFRTIARHVETGGLIIDWRAEPLRNPLHVACAAGNSQLLQYLVENVVKQELKKKDREIIQSQQINTSNILQVLRAENKALPLVPRRHEKTIFISNEGSLGYIEDYTQHRDYYNEIYVYNQRDNTIPAGIYYHTPNGIQPVPVNSRKNAAKMVQNQLSDLSFTTHVNKKKNRSDDTFHNFPELVENDFGQWARVVIDNAADNPQEIFNPNKMFDLHITIPGKISEIDYVSGGTKKRENTKGVFEFVVHKSPYQKKGLCFHRFFNPRGMVAADIFGAEARAEGLQELTKFDLGLRTDIQGKIVK